MKDALIKKTTKELKELKLYRPDMDVIIEMYAQNVIDWREAVENANKHSEFNQFDNGTFQVNAFHTLKKDYGAAARQLYIQLFKPSKIEGKDKDNGKKESKGNLTDIQSAGS